MEVTKVQFFDRVVGVPVVIQRQVSCPLMPQERIQERFAEEIIDVPVSRVMKKVIDVVKRVPHGCVQSNTGVDLTDPLMQKETVEVILLTPQDQIPDRTDEQTVNVPVPQILEEIGGRIQLILQERMSDHVVEQLVGAHVQQIREQMVEVVRANASIALATAHRRRIPQFKWGRNALRSHK